MYFVHYGKIFQLCAGYIYRLTLIKMTKDKGPCFFQRLIALKCLKCQKIKKISNPPFVSYLSYEPNFWLIK
jgi:hypothetical protein